jgi:hypothetical protein
MGMGNGEWGMGNGKWKMENGGEEQIESKGRKNDRILPNVQVKLGGTKRNHFSFISKDLIFATSCKP